MGEEKLSQIKFKSGDFALELLRGINSNAAKLLGGKYISYLYYYIYYYLKKLLDDKK